MQASSDGLIMHALVAQRLVHDARDVWAIRIKYLPQCADDVAEAGKVACAREVDALVDEARDLRRPCLAGRQVREEWRLAVVIGDADCGLAARPVLEEKACVGGVDYVDKAVPAEVEDEAGGQGGKGGIFALFGLS